MNTAIITQTTLEFLLADNVKQQDNFKTMNWATLCERVNTPRELNGQKPEQAKKQLPCITASSAKDKNKNTIIEHDRFSLLRLDLDDTDHTIKTIDSALKSLKLTSYIIHTTSSHTPDNRRYRVYIELSEEISFTDWTLLQTYLGYIFSADCCSSRPQQVMFLPLNTEHYDYKIVIGESLLARSCSWYKLAVEFTKAQEEKHKAAGTKKAADKAKERPTVGTQISIIDLFNTSYSWELLLTSSGYTQQGKAWLPPESTSKAAGAYVLNSNDGRERYYSHHASDPCAIGTTIDKFDFICIRKYDGNISNAVKEISATQFPNEDSHNKREYMVNKHNEDLVKEGS